MKRAAILIGVDKTGDLPRLKDAAKGAALMKTWADAQGIDSVHLLTDEREPVTLARIKDAVKRSSRPATSASCWSISPVTASACSARSTGC